ncbi:hypothetical protein Cdeb_03040 [Caldibacillus debilis GB1]|jgi:hypothetical protein|uniref:Uncharacterized protein n=1 Tax=Caldibacillus debilis GB1 TaxID=1339248 RepID=A0A420VI85_9BACI|nr:hypothetical protein Cdeb_03040 [Caldibacillus debilis GB1]
MVAAGFFTEWRRWVPRGKHEPGCPFWQTEKSVRSGLTGIFRTDGEKEKQNAVARIPVKIFRFGRFLPEPEEFHYEGSVSRAGRPPPGGSACRRFYGGKNLQPFRTGKDFGHRGTEPGRFLKTIPKNTSRHC